MLVKAKAAVFAEPKRWSTQSAGIIDAPASSRVCLGGGARSRSGPRIPPANTGAGAGASHSALGRAWHKAALQTRPADRAGACPARTRPWASSASRMTSS